MCSVRTQSLHHLAGDGRLAGHFLAGGKPQPNAGPSGPAFVLILTEWPLLAEIPMPDKTIALNRRARHEFSIEDSMEAGIVLSGTEIKSIRAGKVNLADAFARIERGEAWLVGAHIAPWEGGNRLNHEPKRDRKLLLHRSQIDQLLGKTKAKGLTLVPLKIYITERGKAKLELGLGKGKQLYDRRREIAARDSRREVERELAESGRR
jgi:SsrA-binding protein